MRVSMKRVLIVTGGIVVLIIVVIAVLGSQKEKIVKKVSDNGFVAMEKVILQNLPKSVDQEEASTICKTAFQKISEKKAPEMEMKQLFASIQTSLQDKKIDSLEAIQILDCMKKINKF